MIQSVRKEIKEVHKVNTEKRIYTLIIDGSNLLRVCMADRKLNSKGEEIGGIIQFMNKMKLLLMKKDFDYVYVFWDGKNSGQKRYEIYPAYKGNRLKSFKKTDYDSYIEEYAKRIMAYAKSKKEKPVNDEREKREKEDRETFDRLRLQIQLMLEELFIRQLSVEEIEGDDLIAYYTLHKQDNEYIVIMSGDRDLSQLLSKQVCLYLPIEKQFLTYDNHIELMGYHPDNVLLKKMICGDDSDNIKGISKVGQATLLKYFPELKERKVTLEEVINHAKEMENERLKNRKPKLIVLENIINGVTTGIQGDMIYEINEKIINLKKPLVNEEAINELNSLSYAPIDPEGRSYENVYRILEKNGVNELIETNRFSNTFGYFERIVSKEQKRYKNSLEKT